MSHIGTQVLYLCRVKRKNRNMITERTKEKLEQVVKDNGNQEKIITENCAKTELTQKDKKRISIVVNSVPIGYIACVVLGIGSWKQMFVYLSALCLSWLISKTMPIKTFYHIGKKSFLICVAYIMVRALIAVVLDICGH